MKRTIVAFSLIAITILALLAVNQLPLLAKSTGAASETMTAANRLYETGQFGPAAQAYQQLVDQGYADGALFYNLGNAYYKQGDLGRALVNYRRAQRLAPRDTDITANLELVRSQLNGPVEEKVETEAEEGLFTGFTNLTRQWLTLNELAILTLGLWSLFVLLVIAFTNSRRGSPLREWLQYAGVMVGLILIVGITSFGSRLYLENSDTGGVVVAEAVTLNSSPNAQSATEFTLPNGTEVTVIEQRENWMRIALPEGDSTGWVPTTAVETVSL